jgi:hypothetical protein
MRITRQYRLIRQATETAEPRLTLSAEAFGLARAWSMDNTRRVVHL